MIKIKRPKAPPFLTDAGKAWYAENVAAREHYRNGNTEPFHFRQYNHADLKSELKKVFTKCAYCDSNYSAVYDGDVEHFRPKGKVKEKDPQTPGYYWLANDWNNLFLACMHCNQMRKHDPLSTGIGKKDQFPLREEAKRWHDPSMTFEEEEKQRLLINPCKEDPEKYFTYEEEGFILPVKNKRKVEMAEKSIEVYALQRPYLVEERKKRLIKLFKAILRVKTRLEELNELPDDTVRKSVFQEALEDLLVFTQKEEDYAGMSRFFVKAFLKENNLI